MKVFPIIFSILIAQVAGIIGSFFTTPNIPIWYSGLVKPSFNPPAWVFGPVWTALFTFMGVAAYLVWKRRRAICARQALVWYGVQLALNVLWSIIFFSLHLPQWAFYEIIILWLAIFITTYKFWRVRRLAGVLLLPYLFWVSFATVLNFMIWQLN